MKKLLFIFLGFFILCAFTGFNPEDIAALEKGIQQAKQEQDPSKDLCQALENKNQVAVVNILDDNRNLVNMDCDGFPPLAYALYYKFQEDVIEFLLDIGAKADAKVKGLYIFQSAVETNNPKIVELMLQHGAKPRMTDKEDGEFRTLEYAIYPSGNVKIVRLLADKVENLNTIVDGKTILDFATDAGAMVIAATKKRTGEDSHESKMVEQKYLTILRILKENGAKNAKDLN